MGGKLPVPNDWDGQSYNIMLMCVPDSQQWRAIIEGAIYDLTYWNKWDLATGQINDAKAVASDIYEGIEMACLADLTRIADSANLILFELQRLNAILAGEKIVTKDENDEEVILADYQENGVVPTANALLKTSGLFGILPDMSLADSVNAGLIGRQLLELPIPGQGDGIADIFDEQTTLLNQIAAMIESHLIMADSSIWNPTTGSKNLVEVLETTLRTTSISDLEPFPNVVDVLQSSLKLADDSFWSNVWRALGLKEPLPDNNTITQVLAGILSLMGRDTSALKGIASAILNNPTIVNVNNGLLCNTNGSGNGSGETSTVTITDEGAQVTGPEPLPLLEN